MYILPQDAKAIAAALREADSPGLTRVANGIDQVIAQAEVKYGAHASISIDASAAAGYAINKPWTEQS